MVLFYPLVPTVVSVMAPIRLDLLANGLLVQLLTSGGAQGVVLLLERITICFSSGVLLS